jgi:non-canonical purine NTP pyrophosphatase (RdgB/HAM1 family)
MNDVVYVTGNEEKARNFALHIGMDIAHEPADLDEIQTLDATELVEHKARQAYEQLKRPVLVEDVTFSFTVLGGLPGPFVKFFVNAGTDLNSGVERMCRMLDGFDDRSAVAACTFGYYDGTAMRFFEGNLRGHVADHPRGDGGFGFDRIFIPDGFENKTAAELDQPDYERYYATIKPFSALRKFLSE